MSRAAFTSTQAPSAATTTVVIAFGTKCGSRTGGDMAMASL
ncbi:hypothetical protein ACS0VI_22760 [Streptomyces sp. H28]|nr:hypothetical protein [Streptomyces sp. H28]